MIKCAFEAEKSQMETIINAKTMILNMKYRLCRDKNVSLFIDGLVQNIVEYENLEGMKKYYFDENFKELIEILHVFYAALQSQECFSKIDSKELARSCHAMPDSGGKETLKLIGLLPIMELFNEKLSYLQAIKFYTKDEKKQNDITSSFKDIQNKKLNANNSLFYKRFPKDDDFIDYDLKASHARGLIKEYDLRESELNESIATLSDMYKKETLLMIGSVYWDTKKKIESNAVNSFCNALSAMATLSEEDKRAKIEKIKLILLNELESMDLTSDLNIYKFGKLHLIEIDGKFSTSNISDFSKVFIIKKDYEVSNIKHIKDRNNNELKGIVDLQKETTLFSCKIEF